VAIAVPDLNSAAERWRQLAGAAAVSSPQAVPAHGVNVVFVTLSNVKIELLGVLGDKSPIASFLDKNKRGGMHHMCLEVDDAAAALAGVRARGQRTLTEVPTPGAHGTPVGFLHPADFDGCLLEVEEVKGGD
jgi:methylmalonyl-CoA/ethylmalonyl-CoA epimerase